MQIQRKTDRKRIAVENKVSQHWQRTQTCNEMLKICQMVVREIQRSEARPEITCTPTQRQLYRARPTDRIKDICIAKWIGSQVVSVLDSGAEGLGYKSQSRRCWVTVSGKLFTPTVPLFTKQQDW